MAYETRGVLLKNRGALGILSNATSDKIGAIPLDPDERDRVQQEYSREYGGLDGQRQLIITSADLRWQQMAISPDKMGLFQETEADFNKILDAFGLPSELFVRAAGSTYENQKQARKGAYVDTIIPDANEWISGINNKYRKGAKTKLIMDYMHLPIFQEDLKTRGDAMTAVFNAMSKAMQDGALTIEEYKAEVKKFGIKI
jgi:phage portal protein BeeE